MRSERHKAAMPCDMIVGWSLDSHTGESETEESKQPSDESLRAGQALFKICVSLTIH